MSKFFTKETIIRSKLLFCNEGMEIAETTATSHGDTMLGKFAAHIVLASLPLFSYAAPTGVDGNIGAEWNGVTATVVPTGAGGTFASPSATATPGYSIYLRSDSHYLYAAVQSAVPGSGANLFANLYFGIQGSQGSQPLIGFEVTNDRAFQPGGPANTYFNDGATKDGNSGLIYYSILAGDAATPDVIEAAIDLSVFNTNALGVTGYALQPGETALGAGLFLSQSLGYDVVGYGGRSLLASTAFPAQVPEPGSLALLGLGLAGLAAVRRRKQG